MYQNRLTSPPGRRRGLFSPKGNFDSTRERHERLIPQKTCCSRRRRAHGKGRLPGLLLQISRIKIISPSLFSFARVAQTIAGLFADFRRADAKTIHRSLGKDAAIEFLLNHSGETGGLRCFRETAEPSQRDLRSINVLRRAVNRVPYPSTRSH